MSTSDKRPGPPGSAGETSADVSNLSAEQRVIPSVRDALIASALREAKEHRAEGRRDAAELLEAMADYMGKPAAAASDEGRDELERLIWAGEVAIDRLKAGALRMLGSKRLGDLEEKLLEHARHASDVIAKLSARLEPLRHPEQVEEPDQRWLHYVGHLDAVLTHLHSLEIAIKVGTNGPIRDAYERLAGRFEKLRDYGTALIKDRHHCHDDTCRAFDGPACSLCGEEDLFCVYTEADQQVCEDCVSEELYLSTRYGRDVAVYELTCEMQEELDRQLRGSTVSEIKDTLKSWTGVMDKINPDMADRLTRLSGLSMVFEAMLDDVTRIELEDPSGGTYAREQEPDPSIDPEQIEAMRRMRASMPRGGFSKNPHAEPTDGQRELRAQHRASVEARRELAENRRRQEDEERRADIAAAQAKYTGLTWKSDARVFPAGADEREIAAAMRAPDLGDAWEPPKLERLTPEDVAKRQARRDVDPEE